MTVPINILRERLSIKEESYNRYVRQADQNGGRLKRHEIWRKDYLAFPYLIGAPDERIAKRFGDILINSTELNSNGKIGLLPIDLKDGFAIKSTHIFEEYNIRGGIPFNAAPEAKKSISRYFENGGPIAIKMFEGYNPPTSPFIVKYGLREFLEPMLHTGRVRLSPASYYNASVHNDAIKDDEINKTFYIPTFRERLKGIHHIDFQGYRIEFGDDDIEIPIEAPDYFLYSLCDHLYYRMPTDFGSNAALIIHNPALFSQRFISAFLTRWPDWDAEYGPVTYYDPYRDYKKFRVHEMSKHFSYAYQREVRIVLRAKRRQPINLEPEFLDIGPMTNYAELIHA